MPVTNTHDKIYSDFLSEVREAGILPPSRVSETMLQLAQENSSILSAKTKLSIACAKRREALMDKLDETSGKPITGTKADSVVASSEEGQKLAECDEFLKAIDAYHWALRAHHESMLREWGKEGETR